jgi:hypothetical protein
MPPRRVPSSKAVEDLQELLSNYKKALAGDFDVPAQIRAQRAARDKALRDKISQATATINNPKTSQKKKAALRTKIVELKVTQQEHAKNDHDEDEVRNAGDGDGDDADEDDDMSDG